MLATPRLFRRIASPGAADSAGREGAWRRAEDEDGGEDQKRRENGTSHRTQSIAARGSSPAAPVGKRCCVAMPSPTPDRVGRYTGRYARLARSEDRCHHGDCGSRRCCAAVDIVTDARQSRALHGALRGDDPESKVDFDMALRITTSPTSVPRRRGPRPGARSPKPVTRHPRRACRARGLPHSRARGSPDARCCRAGSAAGTAR